ncbi:MAG TPA: biopolymer transporter ExbD [Candidatus Acidoferrum sp.]|nr:biopolymer transporter ExbD [Candidatus Acidoferrum sp.]
MEFIRGTKTIMAFLRKGFLKSANRRNELFCRLDPAPFAAIVFALFSVLLSPHMVTDVPVHTWSADRVALRHARTLPMANREDAIWITVTRDGSVYFQNSRTHVDQLPNKIRDAVRNGAEKRIYLNVDARAKYGDVNALLPYIQLSGIENVSFLAETPYHAGS